jgi:hypothetical protein
VVQRTIHELQLIQLPQLGRQWAGQFLFPKIPVEDAVQMEQTIRQTGGHAGREEERDGEAVPAPRHHSQADDAVAAVARDVEPRARVHQAGVPARERAVGVLEPAAQGRQRVGVLVRRRRLQGRRRDHGHDEDGRGERRGSRGGGERHGVVWPGRMCDLMRSKTAGKNAARPWRCVL